MSISNFLQEYLLGISVEEPINDDHLRKDHEREQSWPMLFLAIFLFRVANALVIGTFYVPDEYWQTLEIAHSQIFGYGSRTWEWEFGLKSYIQVVPFSILYLMLKILHLDFRTLLIYTPRILMAALLASSEYNLYRLSAALTNNELIAHLTSGFVFYTGTRTLGNSMESAIIIHSIYAFYTKSYKISFVLSAICFSIRPTSACFFIPFFGLEFLLEIRNKMRHFLIMASVGFGTLGVISVYDSLIKGRFYISFLNLWMFTIAHRRAIRDLSSVKHGYLWYVNTGIPLVLNFHLPTGIIGTTLLIYHSFGKYENCVIFMGSILFSACCYIFYISLWAHKEERFIAPLFPILLPFSSVGIMYVLRFAEKNITRRKIFMVISTLIIFVNITIGLYFALVTS